MNKTELIKIIAENTQLTNVDATKAVNEMVNVITNAVASGDQVQLTGFGTFKQSKRSEREAMNPQTGEKQVIPAKIIPKFVPGKLFKYAVNK